MTRGGFAERCVHCVAAMTVIGACLVLIAVVHRLAHLYLPELTSVLHSPILQVAATSLLLTAFVYLAALSLPFLPRLGPRGLATVFVWMIFLVAGHAISHTGFHDAQDMLSAMRDMIGPLSLVLIVLAYALTLAIPFVPGVELGLLLIAVFGAPGALVVYAATVAGLSLAYAVGCATPARVVTAFLARIGLAMPSTGLVPARQGAIAESRLGASTTRRLGAHLFDHRYVALGVSLNFPGNAALGGGGGLALLCGLSKQFNWRSFVTTVAIATSPVPLLVILGVLDLGPLLEHHGGLHDALDWTAGLFLLD